jgi:hypothetical protein
MSNYVSSLRIRYYVVTVDGKELVCKSYQKARSLSNDIKFYYMCYSILDDGMCFENFTCHEEDFPK